LIKTAIK